MLENVIFPTLIGFHWCLTNGFGGIIFSRKPTGGWLKNEDLHPPGPGSRVIIDAKIPWFPHVLLIWTFISQWNPSKIRMRSHELLCFKSHEFPLKSIIFVVCSHVPYHVWLIICLLIYSLINIATKDIWFPHVQKPHGFSPFFFNARWMLRPQPSQCAAHLGSQPITPGGRGSSGAGHDPRQAGALMDGGGGVGERWTAPLW